MNNCKGLSGSTLKIIAVITMLTDHIGAGILGRIITMQGIYSGSVYNVYSVMRYIGRLAFPIFCFLLVEGFMHTHNVKKYATRLFVFALISEIPFDLFVSGRIVDTSAQNVYFTLFIGLICMWACDMSEESERISVGIKPVLEFLIMIAGMYVSYVLRTDYAAIGVVCIMILYWTRFDKKRQIIAGAVSFAWEISASFAFIPIALYNKNRGINLKYFFYAFYPVHLLVIYIICVIMGIAGYEVYNVLPPLW